VDCIVANVDWIVGKMERLMTVALGLDPGVSGAFALIDMTGEVIAVNDLPVHRISHGRGSVRSWTCTD
jgi:hypothetical protein